MMPKSRHASIFDRLTDSSLYTGTHKHRFDENGNGRGLSGRDRISKGSGFIAGAPGSAVADLSQITRPNLHVASGTGYRSGRGASLVLYHRSPSNDGGSGAAPLSSPGASSPQGPALSVSSPGAPPAPSTPSPRPSSVGRGAMRSSASGAPAAHSSGNNSQPRPGRASEVGDRRSIFDRLNDPSTYTGMHRQRFSSDGRGLGAAGRTMPNAYVSPMDLCR
ncbi:hypothetical protein VOLCADRAFT_103013 [Volvox carteri f. nagariensis]|uniref:Uncharacterized protein n=1 Tax=Volvox carteri f. nagariensis TaxID=3068 RepID=D8TJB7_VOLCA|nr:uncharacterized protein VOLCADRAFT_103013 [Volvox carteri f. nagariensis]EFJ52513.1 hypothetical protein VOLCADRAFT_103013 [Volvox carteri f. nagariensis]|eukprot:XP_002946586.1 hypothetical protein VOLCADRAFT_103013 [Volvox carteri f. nagariensis]